MGSFSKSVFANGLLPPVSHAPTSSESAAPLEAIELEPRVLYSATPFEVADGGEADLNPDLEFESLSEANLPNAEPFNLAFSTTLEQDSSFEFMIDQSELFASLDAGDGLFLDGPKQLVFIDSNVEDWQQLLVDLTADSINQNVSIVMLDEDRSGIEQISETLSRHSEVNAIHLISHGNTNQLTIGGTTLTSQNLGAFSGEISGWQDALADGADFLIYGCDLASSESGRELIDGIGALCDCDVAASDDATGHDALGGDWVLEYQTGLIESDIVFNERVQEAWNNRLLVFSVTSTLDDGSVGTLRWAIDQANLAPGLDTINFNIADTDGGHYYYQDDGIANSLSLVATTILDDGSITDFDPDYPYTPHSWFTIDLDNSRPQLAVTDAVIIDGYSQSGASQNTLSVGDNAVMRVELTNSAAADGKRGLSFQTGANGSVLQGLVVNQFSGVGVMLDYDVDNITVQGNFIGTDITGTLDRGNGDAGIQIRSSNNLIGGSNVEDRNIISGSNSRGIAFFSFGTLTGNVVENNYIGVDSTGVTGLGNNSFGIQLYNTDGAQVIDNVIADSAADGIRLRAGSDVHNSVIQGNLIGVGADGTTLLGNGGAGILVDANNATFNLIGGSGLGEGNIIGDNSSAGISFSRSGVSDNIVIGNSIGTDADGTLDFGNSGSGVLITAGAMKQTIGGVNPGEANTIAFNNLDGVAVLSGFATSIRGNIFKANSDLAIDLIGNNGVNANDINDGDGGGNDLQNYPVLTSASVNGADITIDATFNSRPNTNNYTIDFYWSPTGDTSGHGEAENYIGSATVNTNASGNATISVTFIGANVPVGALVTATATDPSLNTSEFALNIAATQSLPTITSDGGGDTATVNVAENSVAVTKVTATDPELDPLAYNITGGADFALFTINSSTGDLEFLAGRDFETFSDADSDGVYEVQVTVDDGLSNTDVQDISVAITDVNEAPTVSLTGVVGSLTEDTDTTSRVKIADISIADDALGTNNLAVSGADAVSFEIIGTELFLRAGTALDFETKPTFDVTVEVDDTTLGSTFEDADSHTLGISGINEAPTVSLTGVIGSLTEDTDTTSRVKIADVSVTDDALGTNNLAVSGADAASFEIIGTELFLKAGTVLDFETKPTFDVTVEVDDTTLGSTFEDTDSHTLNITDINEAPVFVSNELMITEDTTVTITAAELGATDVDNPGPSLTFSASSVVGGQFELTTAPGVAITSFTQADVSANLVVFVDDGDEFAPSYSMEVNDGSLNDGPQAATITFTNANDVPVGGDDAHSVTAGDTLSGSGLLVNDTDVESTVLTSVLDSLPANGTVVVNPDGSFVYTPNPTFFGTDSFTYLVNDGTDNSAPTTVVVEVLVAPTPPDPTPDPTPDPDPPPVDEVDPVDPPDPVPADDPIETVDPEPETTVAPAPSPVKAGSFEPEPEREEILIEPSEIVWTNVTETKLATKRAMISTLLSGFDEGFLDKTGWFWESLERSAHQLEAEANLPQILLGTSAALTSSVTVGYLVWLVKGGQVAAALAANLPAWQLIDPLPILNGLVDKDEEDDDSLESIIQQGESELDIDLPSTD